MSTSQHSVEPRWRRLPEERPGQILDAALQVFAKHGLAGARLDDIAKLAGVSKGTIYLYFPNKEELFREVVRSMVVENIERGERTLAEHAGTATEALTNFVHGYWDFVRRPEYTAIFRLVNAEIHDFPDLAEFYSSEVVARGAALLRGLIERGIASGEFRTVDPKVAGRMLVAITLMHGLWCNQRQVCRHVEGETDEQVRDEILQFFLHALRPAADPASGRASSQS